MDDGRYKCLAEWCDYVEDGRMLPHGEVNWRADAHGLGVHGWRWRPARPSMGKLLATFMAKFDATHTELYRFAIDERGEWWAWVDGKWCWAPYGGEAHGS